MELRGVLAPTPAPALSDLRVVVVDVLSKSLGPCVGVVTSRRGGVLAAGFAVVFGVGVFAGLGAGYRATDLGVVEEFRIDIKATGFYFKYFDYYPLASRIGLIGELGTGVSF